MSPSPIPIDESAQGPVENADWRRQVEEVQKILTSKAAILYASLKPGNLQSIKDAIEQGPIIFSRLQELEKLQQSRLDDIRQCHDEWQGELSDRTRKLTELDQKLSEQDNELMRSRQRTKQQEDDANKVGRELGALANQRVDALGKLITIKEVSAKHEEFVRQEDIRLDERSAALDVREQDLRSQTADLSRANEALNQGHRDLADKQEQERKREEENKKRTGKINRRLDYLADSQVQWEQQIAALASQVEELKVDNGGLRDTKLCLETRVATVQQEANLAKSDVTRLEGNIQSQDKELSRLRTIEAEKAKLYTSLVHLTGVTLPQKEAELNGFKAELAKTKDNTSASENELKSRISKLDAEKTTLQDQCQEQSTQIKELEEDHAFLQTAAGESSSKASLANEKLAVAQATVGSLELELDYIRKQNDGLEAEVKKLRLCKIDFDVAKRIQDASNAKIQELELERDRIRLDHIKVRQEIEQERDSIRLDRNKVRQVLEQERDRIRLDHNKVRHELEKLQLRHNQMSDEVKKSMALRDEAVKREEDKVDAAHRRCHVAEQQREEVVEESISAKADRDRFATDNDKLRLQRGRLLNEVDALRVERDELLTINDDLQQEKLDISDTLNQTENEVQRLTQQLQSCHCSDKRSSRKRRHDQVGLNEEELSSADGSDRLTRRSGKAPESRASLSATGHSDTVDAVRESARPEVPETPFWSPNN